MSLELRWVSDTLARPAADPPVIVEGMLRAGELCVLAAPRGMGKSWAGMNLAVLAANGEGLMFGALPVRASVPVLIAQGEVLPWSAARRWSMLCGSDAAPLGIAETFDPWRLQVRRVRSHQPAEGGQRVEEWFEGVLDPGLEQAVAKNHFGILVIDPWAVYFAGDENANDQAEAALSQLRDLALRYGIAVVILHHLGKASEARDPEDLWRGASRLADWASTRITLLPHYSERSAREAGLSAVQARRYVDVRFLRRDEPTEPFSAVLAEGGWWCRWEPTEGPRAVGRLSPEDVAAACGRAGGRWTSVAEATQALGMSREASTRALAAAVGAGLLIGGPGERGGRSYRLPTPAAEAGILELFEDRRAGPE